MAPNRLFTTEVEEDAIWQHKMDLISKEELEDILAELEFDNTQIEIDANDKTSLTY